MYQWWGHYRFDAGFGVSARGPEGIDLLGAIRTGHTQYEVKQGGLTTNGLEGGFAT